MVTLKNKNGSVFKCKCGNEDFKYYDGSIGYEAYVCKKCGRSIDHHNKKLQASSHWSQWFVGLISQKEYDRRDALIKEFSKLNLEHLIVYQFRRDEEVVCPQCEGITDTEKVKRRNIHKCRKCNDIFIGEAL